MDPFLIAGVLGGVRYLSHGGQGYGESPRHSEDETHVVYWVFYNYWLNHPSMCSRKRLTVARHPCGGPHRPVDAGTGFRH